MTVGNQARIQMNMAQSMAKYGTELTNMYNSYMSTGKYNTKAVSKIGTTEALNALLKTDSLKNESEEFRSQFSDLYKKIYGIKDDSSSGKDELVSIGAVRTASADIGGSAEAIRNYANKFKYGKPDDFDVEEYRAYAQNFVDNYNAFIDKVGNSDNNNVLKKGVLAVNNAKVYSNALNRAGITLGSDNKLTLQEDLSKVDMIDVKSTFGRGGFSDKIIQRARDINTITGGNGVFTQPIIKPGQTSSASGANSADNAGSIKELTAAIKEAATAVKTYSNSLGSEGKEFTPTDFTDTAKSFIEKYNQLLDETAKSDKASVQLKGNSMQSVTNSYKYALKRAGIEIGRDGKLSLSDAADKLTEKDIKYAFGYGGYLDRINEKADQISKLATSASAMGYTANSAAAYAYTTGAVYNVYA